MVDDGMKLLNDWCKYKEKVRRIHLLQPHRLQKTDDWKRKIQ